MILAAVLYLSAFRQTPGSKPDDIGIQQPNLMVIYKERTVLLNYFGTPTSGSGGQSSENGSGHGSDRVDSGQSVAYDRVGLVNWSVNDGGIQGVPCKIYKGDGTWNYSTLTKKDGVHFHEASYTMLYDIGLDGVPIHSESHFQDVKDADDEHARVVDVSAEYQFDHIVVTTTKNGVADKEEVYPSFGMDRFATMFQPLIQSGIVQDAERDCAVIHPYTGLPYEFKLKVAGHFTGQYFFLPQEGYCIDVVGPQGTTSAFVTRQGQLIKEDLPNRVDAALELGPNVDERTGWGHFSVTDWSRSTEETNPERPKYNTLAIPVLFNNPKILFPVPCLVAN